jgi:hypothetical protein
MLAKLISARSDFSRRCRVIGDLFRRQKTLGLRTYHGENESIFSNDWLRANNFHGNFLRSSAGNKSFVRPIETENAQQVLITC